ncbi:MAG: hypothetical protein JWR25_830 [Noviherbaspirillum sp.]|jgi:hypothetical protein|nr:hypothetical protein [Noviherbaspirillum sp.]MDB5794451.1 hypothetical protein [Noviherbaspirillum sp.]
MSKSDEMLPDENVPSQHAQPAEELLQGRRRRIIQGGIAAPVLMTLVSRRALGGTGNLTCKTASGFMSANASLHGKPTTCTGRTPGYWKQTQHYSAWTSPYQPTSKTKGYSATLFHSTATGFRSGPFGSMGDKTLLQVLSSGGGDVTALARHISAALLNSAASMTPVLNQTRVRTIWNDYVQKGYFEPTVGVKWDAAQIVTYLGHTQLL